VPEEVMLELHHANDLAYDDDDEFLDECDLF